MKFGKSAESDQRRVHWILEGRGWVGVRLRVRGRVSGLWRRYALYRVPSSCCLHYFHLYSAFTNKLVAAYLPFSSSLCHWRPRKRK